VRGGGGGGSFCYFEQKEDNLWEYYTQTAGGGGAGGSTLDMGVLVYSVQLHLKQKQPNFKLICRPRQL
jgi:hypothetical protein